MLSQGNYSKEMVFPKRETAVPKRSIIFQLLASYAGAVLTFHFQLLVQTPVASSALTTGVAWLLLLALHENRRSLISAVYCGSFAGMSMLSASSAEAAGVLFQQAAGFSLAVALCYVLWSPLTLYFPKVTFLGYGGRLGTTAFFSSLLCSLLLREDTAIISLNPIAAFPETHVSEMTYAVIACGGAIIPCLLLGKRWRTIDMYDLTGLTALLSLSASLLCKLFFEDLHLAPAAFYTGLFVSMTRPHLCGPPKLAIARTVSGLLMLYFTHVFNGIGGSQGLAAMLAVASVTTFDSCLPARPVRKALVAVLTMAFVCWLPRPSIRCPAAIATGTPSPWPRPPIRCLRAIMTGTPSPYPCPPIRCPAAIVTGTPSPWPHPPIRCPAAIVTGTPSPYPCPPIRCPAATVA